MDMNESSAQPAAKEAAGPIHVKINQMEHNFDLLFAEIEELRNKLAPIMQEEIPKTQAETSGTSDEQGESVIWCRLSALNNALREARLRIKDLKDRAEL